MPLHQTIDSHHNAIIYIWHITESLSELNAIYLNDVSQNRIEKMKSESHQKSFLAVRHLFKVAGYSDDDVSYLSSGKPVLKGSKHISISHSFEYATIIISEDVAGIDIEKYRPKIERIASKFIKTENTFLEQQNITKHLTQIWNAKEALFKIDPEGGLSFKDHLVIAPFKTQDQKTTGQIVKDSRKEIYTIYFHEIADFSLAYAIKTI